MYFYSNLSTYQVINCIYTRCWWWWWWWSSLFINLALKINTLHRMAYSMAGQLKWYLIVDGSHNGRTIITISLYCSPPQPFLMVNLYSIFHWLIGPFFSTQTINNFYNNSYKLIEIARSSIETFVLYVSWNWMDLRFFTHLSCLNWCKVVHLSLEITISFCGF